MKNFKKHELVVRGTMPEIIQSEIRHGLRNAIHQYAIGDFTLHFFTDGDKNNSLVDYALDGIKAADDLPYPDGVWIFHHENLTFEQIEKIMSKSRDVYNVYIFTGLDINDVQFQFIQEKVKNQHDVLIADFTKVDDTLITIL